MQATSESVRIKVQTQSQEAKFTYNHILSQVRWRSDQPKNNHTAALRLNFTSILTWTEGALVVNIRQALSDHFNS